MKQKQVAREIDLRHHIADSPLNAHGIIDALRPEDWIAPTLINSWVNYNTATHQPAGYYRDAWGIVHLRGTLKSGTVTVGTTLFTLPAGYRPSKYQYIHGATYDGANYSWTILYVDSSGNVKIGEAVNNTLITIDGGSFRAEQ